jgi:DNA mismatch repair protein MSH6
LWTALRKTEGLDYDETIAELHTLYPDEEEVEGTGIPSAIKSMLECRSAMESLGSMIW